MRVPPASIVHTTFLLQGYKVDIFEANSHAGGMAQVGIPQYRLPKGLLESETDVIEELGRTLFLPSAPGL